MAGYQWVDHLSDAVKFRTLSDRDCSRLSDALGLGWEHVMAELGLSRVKVEQEKSNNHHNHANTVTSLLIKWRQSSGRDARLLQLLQALSRANERCTIDWDEVRAVVDDM